MKVQWTLLALCFWIHPLSTRAAAPAGDVMARIVSVQGEVSLLPAGTADWIQIATEQDIKVGWGLRTGPNSRARVRLRDQSVITVGPSTSMQFGQKQKRFLTRVLQGIISFFHRDEPGELEVESPEVAAVIYGTEFVFAVAPDGVSTMTLYDGRVEMTGGLVLTNGEVAVATRGQPPHKTASITLNNLQAVQWCLYYPAILDLDELGSGFPVNPPLQASVAQYRSGDLLGALNQCPANWQPATQEERVYRAALMLSVGNVAGAEALMAQVQANPRPPRSSAAAGSVAEPGLDDPNARLSAALRQLMAVVQLRPGEPLVDARRTNLLATEWLALSYYQQFRGQLAAARDSARQATQTAPAFGFAWARLAELEFGFGRRLEAMRALNRSLALSPHNAQAVAIRGFVLCDQNDIAQAQRTFEQALSLDSALGNAWLGRGLCRIQRGDLSGGEQDLLIAAATEPQRSLLRSYLGKAFSERRQYAKAAHEFGLAMNLDPLDPTPWLYRALLRENRNWINPAIADLERSKQLNDNRYLYRSRLMLDQDLAVRSANLAALYRDADLTEVAQREAGRAVNYDYANASAHQFLANAYDALRDPRLINLRYESAWLNELLLANLLAPVGMGNLSQHVSQQEYSSLFDRGRIGLLTDSMYLSRGDWLQTASQYGYSDRLGYALDLDYRSENGQRANEDRTSTTVFAKTKIQLSPQDSLLVMANTLDYHAGDLRQYYDPAGASRTLRVTEYQQPNLFLGFHREWQPGSHTLVLLGRLDDTLRLRNSEAASLVLKQKGGQTQPFALGPFGLDYERQLEAYSAEVQQIWQTGRHTFIAGGRYQAGWPEVRSTFTPPPHPWFSPAPLVQNLQTELERGSLYFYDQWQLLDPLRLEAGVSYDRLDYPVNVEWPPYQSGQLTAQQVSPKLGLDWQLATNTHLYAAWTRSLGGAYYDNSLRLEPSQIAGFNQTYRSLIPESAPGAAGGLVPGARFETWSLGLDHQFRTQTYLGIEGNVRREQATRTIGGFESVFPSPATISQTRQNLEYTEKSAALTLNQLAGRDWSFGLRYRASLAELQVRYPGIPAAAQQRSNVPLDSDGDGLLQELRLSALFNHPSGFFGQVAVHWHDQSNGGAYQSLPGESFWQGDVFVGYRFWQRRAMVQVGLLNLTDQDYRLNPVNLYQELPRERTLMCRLQLSF